MSAATKTQPTASPALPMNIEVEQALLGAVIAHPQAWALVQGIVRPQDFFEPLHARIFEAAMDLAVSGKIISPLILKAQFEQDATINEIGGWSYLSRLTSAAGPMISVQGCARHVRQLSDRRTVMTACRATEEQSAVITTGDDFRQTLSEHIAELTGVFDGARERKTTFSIAEAGRQAVDRVRRLKSGEADPDAIPTGFAALDAVTGGIRRGEYIVLGARPSMGKTALAVQLAANVAETGRGVAYFSLEMPTALLMPRFLAGKLWTPGGPAMTSQQILRDSVTDAQMRWIESAEREMAAWPLIIDEEPALTAAEIEARARVIATRLKNSGVRLDLVIVDHLHKCRYPGASSKVNEFTEISAGLAEAAKRLDLPLVALAQLNRALEARDEKRPSLADLRESGAIEQDADTVAFLYREAYYLERTRCRNAADEADRLAKISSSAHKLELIIAKQRSGPIATIPLWADMAANAVRDISEVTR